MPKYFEFKEKKSKGSGFGRMGCSDGQTHGGSWDVVLQGKHGSFAAPSTSLAVCVSSIRMCPLRHALPWKISSFLISVNHSSKLIIPKQGGQELWGLVKKLETHVCDCGMNWWGIIGG